MVQVIPPKNLSGFGQLVKGFAQGAEKQLAEGLPKALERRQLNQGLQQLQKDAPNLSETQQLSRLFSVPGLNPLHAQVYQQALMREGKAKALSDMQSQPPPAFPNIGSQAPGQPSSSTPSLTQPDSFEKAQEGFIPPNQAQRMREAQKAFEQNPKFFINDPANALAFVEDKYKKEQDIANAHQTKHQNLTAIQDNLVNRLKTHSSGLGVQIPANVYSDVENDAIQAIKPKKEGGRGLTEQQSMKEYGEKLDSISRDYKGIDTIGNWGIVQRSPAETLRSISSLQKKFKARDDIENFADSLVSKSKFSYPYAYAMADPIEDYKELNILTSLSPLEKVETMFTSEKSPKAKEKTRELSKFLTSSLAKGASPLAISFELEQRGYDGSEWLQYLSENRDKLNLSERQGRQLDKPRNFLPTMNDWWLQTFTGK